MITSVSNPKIKNVRALLSKKKERDEQGCFVIEGRKPVLEALGSQLEVKEIYLAESFEDDAFAGVPEDIAMRVSDRVFSQLSQTVTPQGVAAVVKMPSYSLGDMVSNDASRLLILEDIRDPGNLGTMIRTSEAAGIGGVIMTRNTVDVFNPKVVRATMGSVLRVPFVYTDDLSDAFGQLKKKGYRVIGTSLASSVDYREADLSGRIAIVIGNEASGMSPEAVGLCDSCVHIPMAGRVESLNAAIAAAILMFAR